MPAAEEACATRLSGRAARATDGAKHVFTPGHLRLLQVGHLTALGAALPGKLELFNADLLKEGDFDEVCR